MALKGNWTKPHRKGGRPRKADWDRIAELRKQGLSYGKIETITGTDRGAVGYAVRTMGLR